MKKNDLIINIYDSLDNLVVERELEELVLELMVSTVPIFFHIETLKCQSMIIRTNILKKIKNYKNPGGNGLINKGVAQEDLKPWKSEKHHGSMEITHANNMPLIIEAVEATKGLIIIFNEKPIDARFHQVCGGSTENSENVDGNVVVYLRRVLCQYCKDSQYYNDYKDIEIEEVEKRLGVKFTEIDGTKNVSIENMIYDITRDDTGRILKLTIAGKEFDGKEARKLLKLQSTRFSWKPQSLRFVTIGKGDGVGFCQYGANGMATEGKKAEEIIKYYYTGVEIKKIQDISINKPLLGKVLVIDPAHGGKEGDHHVSPKGLKEKELNLEIAFYLKDILCKLGATIHLTRYEDNYVPITERAKLVNEIKPNFFLTIHQNYLKNSNVSGTEIYYYRGDQEANYLGQLIMEKMTEGLGTINRGIKTAEFYLLRDINVSGLHIEVAYLSNKLDEEKLMKEEFKHQVAEAISEAIVSYFQLNY